jgi:hypothetical protein
MRMKRPSRFKFSEADLPGRYNGLQDPPLSDLARSIMSTKSFIQIMAFGNWQGRQQAL